MSHLQPELRCHLGEPDYSRPLLEAMNQSLKMDLTERIQNVDEFMALLNIRPDESRVMNFLNRPVRLGWRRS